MDDNKPIKCPVCDGSVTVERTAVFESHICENCLNYAKIIELTCWVKPKYQLVKFTTASNTIQIREQCMYCGNLKGNSVGGLTKTERDNLPLADVDKRERRTAFVSNGYKLLSDKKIDLQRVKNEETRKQRLEEYSNYLQSPEWEGKRKIVLKRDNYLCQSCLKAPAVQVHHKSYEFCDLKGNEPCFDLVSVCIPCHDYIEAKKKENRLSIAKP